MSKLMYGSEQLTGQIPNVVDSITSGNMNAVTSNAVNSALTNYGKIENVTMEFISGVTVYSNNCYKIGNAVFFSAIIITTQAINHNDLLLTIKKNGNAIALTRADVRVTDSIGLYAIGSSLFCINSPNMPIGTYVINGFFVES